MLRTFSIPLFILATGERRSLEFRYTPLRDEDFEELSRAQSLTGEERRSALFQWLSVVLVDMKAAESERVELTLVRLIEMGDAWAYRLTRTLVTRTCPGLRQVGGLQIRYQDSSLWPRIGRKRVPEEVLSSADLVVYDMAWEFKKSPDEIRSWSLEDRNWLIAVASAQGHAQKEIARRAAAFNRL